MLWVHSLTHSFIISSVTFSSTRTKSVEFAFLLTLPSAYDFSHARLEGMYSRDVKPCVVITIIIVLLYPLPTGVLCVGLELEAII